jgi:hypothetical protein
MISQLFSAVEKPTSQYALIQSPYRMIQQRILIQRRNQEGIKRRIERMYPNEIHTIAAHRAFVTTIPYVLIIGKITAIPAAMRVDRRPLQSMAVRLHVRSLVGVGRAPHPFAAKLSALLECMTSIRYAAHGPNAISTCTMAREYCVATLIRMINSSPPNR